MPDPQGAEPLSDEEIDEWENGTGAVLAAERIIATLRALTHRAEEAEQDRDNARMWAAALDEDRQRLRGEVELQRQYIELLENAERESGGYLFVHGWRTPEDQVAEGKRLREAIAALAPPVREGEE
jgi:hypothetical protein